MRTDHSLSTLPFRLTLGVTGHRNLQNTNSFRQSIQDILTDILQRHQPTEHTEMKLCILSPLAEGADRLVVEEILRRDQDAVLKAVLPLTVQDYMDAFGL